MSENSQFGGNTGTPAGGKGTGQDYGFFAPASPAAAPTQFGSPSGQANPPPNAAPPPAPPQFGAPPSQNGAPPSQFGAAPPQFGAPPPQFGAPPAYGQPSYPPAPRRRLPVWAIVAICVPAGLVVLGIIAAIAIPVFLNQGKPPVMPATLGGLSQGTDPTMTQMTDAVRQEVTKQNPGRKLDAATYGTVGTGYLLVGMNARVDTAREFRDLGAIGDPTTFGDVECATGAERVSMCLHNSVRGSVEVLRFGPMELSQLAAVTQEAWAGQPFAQ